MNHSKPYISLCLIVKNEEPYLRRCLESFVSAYDELIVVDTGSRDRTVEIAGEFGAQVDFFRWRNDFGAARNYACSLAGGEWIMMVDGDESLAPKGIASRLPEMLRQVPVHVDKLLIEQRTILGDETVSLFVDRIFRNLPKLSWKYRIHEVIETPAQHTAKTHEFYLLHDNALKRRKDKRVSRDRESMYLQALTLDMNDYPDDPRPAFYLAGTLYGAKRYQEAMDAYEQYFRLSENKEPARRAVAFRDAAAVAAELGDKRNQRSLLFRSLEHDWRSSETYIALADSASENKNPDETIHWLTVAASCRPMESDMYWTASASVSTVWKRLAGLYHRQGDENNARACKKKADRLENEGLPCTPNHNRPRNKGKSPSKKKKR